MDKTWSVVATQGTWSEAMYTRITREEAEKLAGMLSNQTPFTGVRYTAEEIPSNAK